MGGTEALYRLYLGIQPTALSIGRIWGVPGKLQTRPYQHNRHAVGDGEMGIIVMGIIVMGIIVMAIIVMAIIVMAIIVMAVVAVGVWGYRLIVLVATVDEMCLDWLVEHHYEHDERQHRRASEHTTQALEPNVVHEIDSRKSKAKVTDESAGQQPTGHFDNSYGYSPLPLGAFRIGLPTDTQPQPTHPTNPSPQRPLPKTQRTQY